MVGSKSLKEKWFNQRLFCQSHNKLLGMKNHKGALGMPDERIRNKYVQGMSRQSTDLQG